MVSGVLSTVFNFTGKRVWVAGHRGMVGSAIVRRLAEEPCTVITAGREMLDLTRQNEVENWMIAKRPDAVVVAAARVGGIHANNTLPVEFLRDNISIELNIIEAAHKVGVEKLLFLGSSCIYPREAEQPMREDMLLTGPLEPTNEWYAMAKIAGIKLCQAYRRQYGCDFISIMPTNLYGPGDNFHPLDSHVPAALMRRAHEAKERGDTQVVVWGTGRPRREFLYVDDMADACIFIMKNYSGDSIINVGTGEDVSIYEFAREICNIVGFQGEIVFDHTKPDGAPRKLLDVSRLNGLGWQAAVPLREGLERTYTWFQQAMEKGKIKEMGNSNRW